MARGGVELDAIEFRPGPRQDTVDSVAGIVQTQSEDPNRGSFAVTGRVKHSVYGSRGNLGSYCLALIAFRQ